MAEPSLGDAGGPAERAAAREEARERADAARQEARERADANLRTRRERMDSAREVTRDRVDAAREATAERVEKARLTFRRLTGLDRSGPPPPQTLPGEPWRVWTIPNVIGFVRLATLPVFLALALSSESGTDPLPAALFIAVAVSDYADGIAARVTGQYSRFGALLDPVVDRLLVVSGVVVCWHFELLPRWAIALLVARELFMLVAGQLWLRKGLQLAINWPGRAAVWPTMAAIGGGLCGVPTAGEVLLYIGLALSWLATALYVRSGVRQLRARRLSSSA